MADVFRIAFNGAPLPGFPLDLVRRNARERLKATPEQLVRMFSGRTLYLKKDLDEAAALEYLRRLRLLGLDVTLENTPPPPVAAVTKQVTTPAPAARSTDAAPAAPSSDKDSGWMSDTGFADFARTHLNLSRAEALLNGNIAEETPPAALPPTPQPTAAQVRALQHENLQPLASTLPPPATDLQLSGSVLCPHCGNSHSVHGEILLRATPASIPASGIQS